MQVYLETLGCRLNYSEMESLARQLRTAGHHVVGSPAEAHICVLNTCAVTNDAGRTSRQTARALSAANPRAHLLVTGCYAELEGDTVAALPGVRWVVGNQDKARIPDLLEQADHLPAMDWPTAPAAAPFALSRTRAFVKVQDGCNNRCTFCIVTVARGAERSRPIDELVVEVQALAAEGVQEAALTGVHLGGYGRDLGTDLKALVAALLARTTLPRLRLSSLEPFDLEPDFFDLWQNPRLCPHLHLPLQSGCDATLKRMARRYTAGRYAELVAAARARIPDVLVTTDVIVGFPGETEAEFAASLAFIEQMQFAHLHVFPYSRRQGTVAAQMPGHVTNAVKQEWAAALRAVDLRSGRAIRRHALGQARAVLWEGQGQPLPDGTGVVWSGLTDNYLRVLTVAPLGVALHNTITPATLTRLEGDALWADIR